MEYHVLASGSKGNSVFIYDKDEGVLIDCGISRKQLLYKLSTLGFKESDIDYVFLTHDHYDHNKSISIFDEDIVFGGEKNAKGKNVLLPYNNYKFGHLDITPLSISHDAHTPLAFVIEGYDETLLYMTDTGYVSQKNQAYIQNLEYYIIESNHDIQMLMDTNRPIFLKNRILGDSGHLDNNYSAELMAKVIGDKTKEICLAHLSQQANTKEKALEAYNKVFNKENIKFNNIKVADQVDIVSGGKHED
ncbi:MAG: MBL fold metallo-hydrolase [Thomasclavelia sp.]|jgi:phosphoribosyl 1,2-cyclic phosphodiesterase|nr:MBL fold metallo-hydrolase [Thomasclavelia sp.]